MTPLALTSRRIRLKDYARIDPPMNAYKTSSYGSLVIKIWFNWSWPHEPRMLSIRQAQRRQQWEPDEQIWTPGGGSYTTSRRA